VDECQDDLFADAHLCTEQRRRKIGPRDIKDKILWPKNKRGKGRAHHDHQNSRPSFPHAVLQRNSRAAF
jgi:hypothetical protein